MSCPLQKNCRTTHIRVFSKGLGLGLGLGLVNTELQKLSCWFQANKLSINQIVLYLRPVKIDKSLT